MKLAFYKGNKTIFDKITTWRTGGSHSHVELVFSTGESFSSSQWDGGVRFKKIEYDTLKWDILELFTNQYSEKVILEWCKTQNGKNYDWRGVLGIFIGKKEDDPDKWFCSEICTKALQQVGLLTHLVPCYTSPETLWNSVMSMVKGNS